MVFFVFKKKISRLQKKNNSTVCVFGRSVVELPVLGGQKTE